MTTILPVRNAFSLIELLVVITIIAVLAAVGATKYGQIRENGWSTRCKGNLKNLYQASMNYMVEHPSANQRQMLPAAYPYEWSDSLTGIWYVRDGWVTWIRKTSPETPAAGLWPDSQPHGNDVDTPIWYGSKGQYAIQQGSIWDYCAKDLKSYICPKFAQSSVCGRSDAVRSYVMNNEVHEWQLGSPNDTREPSRTILFAEMQPQKAPWGTHYPGAEIAGDICDEYATSAADSDANDGTLKSGDGSDILKPTETIGYLHRMGSEYRGHVVFCDGHIEAVGLKNAGGGAWSNQTYAACHGLY